MNFMFTHSCDEYNACNFFYSSEIQFCRNLRTVDMSRLFFFVPKIPEIRKKNDLASGGTEITPSVYQSINATSWNVKKNFLKIRQ